jgi:hypothetical protein
MLKRKSKAECAKEILSDAVGLMYERGGRRVFKSPQALIQRLADKRNSFALETRDLFKRIATTLALTTPEIFSRTFWTSTGRKEEGAKPKTIDILILPYGFTLSKPTVQKLLQPNLRVRLGCQSRLSRLA